MFCGRNIANKHNLKMAIHIEGAKTPTRPAKIQYTPFKISTDDKANISAYFTNQIKATEADKSVLSASFRGYPLIGKDVGIPDGYTGVILQERIKPETDKDDRKFYVMDQFSSFVYWNWDKIPSKNDAVLRALTEWIDVAEALHAPVSD